MKGVKLKQPKNQNTKKSTTSKRPKGRQPRKYKINAAGESATFKRSYEGEDFRVDIKPKQKEDVEKILPEPDDEASKHKFPPPKKHPTFRAKWFRFIDNVSSRDNFKVGHLDTLEILCDLYVEYEQLHEFVRVNGRSYLSVGRQGEVWKFYPEVLQLTKVQGAIKEYTKMLDLILKKDHGAGDGGGGEKSEWE